VRDVEHELAGVSGRAHHPDRGRTVGQRVVRGLRQRQHPVGDLLVHRLQQAAQDVRVGQSQQRQVHRVEREVAPEREQAHLAVAVDVALADLDEAATEGQQFQAGTLRGARQGVQHDVDAVAVGVAPDLVGERRAAGIVDVLDSPVAQQLPTLRATCGGEDLRPSGLGYRDRGLSDAAGGGVDEHLVARTDAGQVVQ
jgi:hypothetical protein